MQIEKNIIYSIIIPHKNIPDLLIRCIESIPIKNEIEIIVVDDNSDPNIIKPSDIEQLKKKYTNLTFIYTTENKGAGYARNIGLNIARGKWIIFADADDFFHINFYSTIEKYKNKKLDIIFFHTNSLTSDTLSTVSNREDIFDLYLKKQDINILKYMSHSVWGKMFSSEFIYKNKIKCDETPASNDVVFSGLAGIYATNIAIDKNIIYCCTVRNGSICTKINQKNVEARIHVAFKYNLILKEHSINIKYWMNILGPIISMLKINRTLGIKYLIRYLQTLSFQRISLDLIQSGNRFIKRIIGKNNDKEIRKFQSQQ